MRPAALALLLLASPAAAQPKQLPPDLVAPTDALSPADERKAFTVPAGFDVQLVASEPDIQKPMQMAWDAKGRLWVTTSYHYPFPAPQGKGTDKLFVLSDFDAETGKAKKVQVFASDLNIPIGVLPLPDCKSVIVSSTGEIRKYTDTDDDGKADKTEVLFGGFGFRDTHGMTNSFTLMPDGWVYACHGFNNDSKVKGTDGHEVKMHSGHTFRFRPDGSRIEVYTRGQVNPFGIAVDPWFNLYTADCHSKPITQLIPGAYYDSFGKPHDGLGYGPHVTRHDHGSTGLCGLTWYDADQFPKDYLGCVFVGNVVTNRINFDRIEWKGSSPVAKELPDFLTSTDRWFRPVDIKLGPDGALYVADFYNKVIGHYEVDLKHPGRDKDRGRLWRIVWKGKDEPGASATGAAPKFAFTDLTTAKPEELAKLLASPNLTVRQLVTQECIERMNDPKAFEAVGKAAVGVAMKGSGSRAVPHCIWILERNGEFRTPPDMLVLAYIAVAGTKGEAGDFALPHNLFRPLLGRDRLADDFRKQVRDLTENLWKKGGEGFQPQRPGEPSFVSLSARVYAELAARNPHADFVKPLVELLKTTPAEDTHLRQAVRIALRNCLRDADGGWKAADALTTDAAADGILAGAAVGVPGEPAAKFLAVYVLRRKDDPNLPAFAEHVGRHGTPAEWKRVLDLAASLTVIGPRVKPEDIARGLELFRQMLRGAQAGGKQLSRGQFGPEGDLDRFELVARSGLHTTIKNPATARTLAEVYAALPAAVKEADRPVAFSLTRLVHLGLIQNPDAGDEARGIAVDTLGRLNLPNTAEAVAALAADAKASPALREKSLIGLASMTEPQAKAVVTAAWKDAPYRTAVALGTALAARPHGAGELLAAIKDGTAPARLLQEKAVLERLRAAKVPDLDKQVAALTKGLPPADQRLAELVKTRAKAFASVKPDKELGAKIFAKNCAACHRIGDQGGKVAPQLDGIGVRGLERLLEDTLDPNRNVDQAFRARVITTKDEKTITGLMLRVEGEVVVVADAEGKELRIPTKDIDTNRETMLSPMPANFGEVVTETDFAHLMAYLLDQKAAAAKQ